MCWSSWKLTISLGPMKIWPTWPQPWWPHHCSLTKCQQGYTSYSPALQRAIINGVDVRLLFVAVASYDGWRTICCSLQSHALHGGGYSASASSIFPFQILAPNRVHTSLSNFGGYKCFYRLYCLPRWYKVSNGVWTTFYCTFRDFPSLILVEWFHKLFSRFHFHYRSFVDRNATQHSSARRKHSLWPST